mmetsp:Transcript_58640/g.96817  ORF Transcript_58640/g.96817 Transcript_58640/m.96817 type:complete len:155 (+) Transcript_58640:143-607(+)
MQAYDVVVPPGFAPGSNIHANIGGQIMLVQVPAGVTEGQKIRVTVAAAPPQPQPQPLPPPQPHPRPQLLQGSQRHLQHKSHANAQRHSQSHSQPSVQKHAHQQSQHDSRLQRRHSETMKDFKHVSHSTATSGAPRIESSDNDEVSALWWLNMGI